MKNKTPTRKCAKCRGSGRTPLPPTAKLVLQRLRAVHERGEVYATALAVWESMTSAQRRKHSRTTVHNNLVSLERDGLAKPHVLMYERAAVWCPVKVTDD